MKSREGKLEKFDAVIRRIISDWYERVREHYVTDEDSRDLGVEPEVKCFHEFASHRIKFSRTNELDVTYGLGVEQRDGSYFFVASVNNKSDGFDYDSFVEHLKAHYWRSRNDKPWTKPEVDHFSYGDLMEFEPKMGKSVSLDMRKEKADIVRLYFALNREQEGFFFDHPELLRDLIENYCLLPLKRTFAESYREQD